MKPRRGRKGSDRSKTTSAQWKGPCVFLSAADIHAIHKEQLAVYGGAEGVIDAGVIESSVAAPQWDAKYGGDEVDAAYLAASYLYHFATTQGFRDGNKRTAVVASVEFLARNGYRLRCKDLDMYAIAMQIAKAEIDTPTLAAWFRSRLRPIR